MAFSYKCIQIIVIYSTIDILCRVKGVGFSGLTSVNDQYGNISSLTPDAFRTGVLLVCAGNAVFEFDTISEQYSLIAGSHSVSGYAEGEGAAARFQNLKDVVQVGKKSLIVSDAFNHCLRWINSSQTSPLTGKCTELGYQDGHLLEAKFDAPWGLLLILNDHIYVSDFGNHAIRLVSLATSTITTVIRDRTSLIYNPFSLTCRMAPLCAEMFIVFQHGVSLYNRINNTVQLVAGTRSMGRQTGSLSSTQFRFPNYAIYLTENILVVADDNNNRLVNLDLKNETSQVSLLGITDPTAILCFNFSVYIGTPAKLFKTAIEEVAPDDLFCNNPSIGHSTAIQTTVMTTVKDSTTLSFSSPLRDVVLSCSTIGGCIVVLTILVVAIIRKRRNRPSHDGMALRVCQEEAVVYESPDSRADQSHVYDQLTSTDGECAVSQADVDGAAAFGGYEPPYISDEPTNGFIPSMRKGIGNSTQAELDEYCYADAGKYNRVM